MIEDENSITNRLIQDSGISQGMRVLDLGCGKGEVSVLLAKAVGPCGEVVGIDRNQRILELAKDRINRENLSNVNFLNVELSNSLPDTGMYDAIVGRRVLMYLPNPSDILSRLLRFLKNGGIVAFQEVDSTVPPVHISPHPLHEIANKWIWETIRKEGANINMGFTLPSLLKDIGVVVSSVKAEANIQGQKSHSPMSTVVREILHRIIEQGVASEEEINIETLEGRLNSELSDGSVFISDMSFSICGRKTGGIVLNQHIPPVTS